MCPLAKVPSSIPHVIINNSHTWLTSLPPVTYTPSHSHTIPAGTTTSSSMESQVTSSTLASALVSKSSPSIVQDIIDANVVSPYHPSSVPTSTIPSLPSQDHCQTKPHVVQPSPQRRQIHTYTRDPHRSVVTYSSLETQTPTSTILPEPSTHAMVTRAKASIQKPNPCLEDNWFARMARPVFVGNFEPETRQSDLERLFSKYGRVERVDMKSGKLNWVFLSFC
ncbi:hypothetical protein DKX38_003095 [Salix brachista]|uniref:RRM domain-containing protein n=1 Tax=Salix brachista TaxID=2182728 RepID=A0A5N5NPT5_9ROSI|nr:hypothetical protein DKX38_003095 [Salix brachista]